MENEDGENKDEAKLKTETVTDVGRDLLRPG